MRNIIIFLLLIFPKDQKAQELSFLDSVLNGSEKTVVIYTIASWCTENLEDFSGIKHSLMTYRSRIHLTLLLDSVCNQKYDFNLITNQLAPDKIIFLNPFFPKRLHTISENKAYTKYVNRVFGTNFYRLGPATLLLMKDNVVSAIPIIDRNLILSKRLEE